MKVKKDKVMENQQRSLKSIPSFPDYLITEDGRIKSLKSQKWLRLFIQKDGYKKVSLRRDGVTFKKSVHRLVAETFLDNPNGLPVVHHLNDDKLDNRVENLKWATYSENNAQDYALKPSRLTKNQHSGKRDAVRHEVLILAESGLSAVAISKIVGLSDVTIGKILKERSTTRRKP